MADISRIVSVVQIESVRLCEGICRSFVKPDEVAEAIDARLSHAHSIVEAEDKEKLLVRVTFRCQVQKEDNEKAEQAEIFGVFELSYRIPGKESFSSDELEEFAQVNAVFNAWPYWREYVQASLVRMGMPIIMIPVFRVPRKKTTPDSNGRTPRKKKRGAS